MLAIPPSITDISVEELRSELDLEPRYRLDQIQHAVYSTNSTSFDDILTLPVGTREALAKKFSYEAVAPLRTETSLDGTKKVLLRTGDGSVIETVQMPTERHKATTICLSSQAGCAMGCTFCATGDIGLTRNLTSGEIIDQFLYFRRRSGDEQVPDRAVFMGMGEPLANLAAVEGAVRGLVEPGRVGLGARRVTVSTVGLPSGIRALADWGLSIGLAISLHAAVDEIRQCLVPVARRILLEELMDASTYYQRIAGRRVTYEYTMLEGVNDSRVQAKEVVHLLRGQRCHLNLIPFNSYPGARYRGTAPDRIRDFRDVVGLGGVSVTIRRTRGRDISGACGQLHAGGLTN
ncbi:MAG: 23S rRNA (adenine(2503)-C(2))-methyltransferase RlmN [Chloroflexi bacterium]|nr:23S rRNA (adenine(2503)-C(2))-methyltransferase RlmN [Chloroflexota bacterium]HCU73187.1 23S rRNA (adenine(2503)-C(2))-methyltransferase RlmN [Chloroflexota bacterium]|tara:strand:- start:9066 stop:10109 length:1044 start_codon:yes stop_codon:yes gene_type:complete